MSVDLLRLQISVVILRADPAWLQSPENSGILKQLEKEEKGGD